MLKEISPREQIMYDLTYTWEKNPTHRWKEQIDGWHRVVVKMGEGD